jgi:hypothetical protein
MNKGPGGGGDGAGECGDRLLAIFDLSDAWFLRGFESHLPLSLRAWT